MIALLIGYESVTRILAPVQLALDGPSCRCHRRLVIASWSYGLIRDTGAILLDRIPDRQLAGNLCSTIESDGSKLADLHLWRSGPGHLGAIVSVCPKEPCTADYYRAKLARIPALSHITIEIQG
jgi:Co/Zn/Cd efflux system component